LKRIRILLAGMPRLLLDVLHQVIASEPDMAVVGRVGRRDLDTAIRRTRADVLLVGQKSGVEQHVYVRLLMQRPHLRIVAIADNGRNGSRYELRPRRIRLHEMSAHALRSAIRGRQRRSDSGHARRKPVEVC
jgi:chemotaxis response regulator CheB